MSQIQPTLHFMCGKVASGKSTLTKTLGCAPGTVVLVEDEWLVALFAEEMASISDYVRCAARLEAAMGPHVVSLLRSGVSVVLDFQANTLARRAWMRSLFEASQAAHVLHFLDTPDAVCKARLRARNAGGGHPFSVTDAQFEQLSRHFVPPYPEEGFNMMFHGPDAA